MAANFSFLKNRKDPDVIAKRREILTKRREGNNLDVDFIYIKKFPRFQVKDGGTEHVIRILPASWENAEDYGLRIFPHYNVGLHKSSFLCLDRMGRGKCPICEEVALAGDDKEAELLKVKYSFLMWIIDRSDSNTGPKLWAAPAVVERQLAQTAYDKKTNTFIFYDDPDEGFDINFTVAGKKPFIKYEGVMPDRQPSPLGTPEEIDKWLKFIAENPLPNLLSFKNEEYIRNVLHGLSGNSASSEEPKNEESKQEVKKEEPKKLEVKADHQPPPKSESTNGKVTSHSIDKMNRDEVTNIINSLQLSIVPDEWEDTADLKEAVKVELGIN